MRKTVVDIFSCHYEYGILRKDKNIQRVLLGSFLHVVQSKTPASHPSRRTIGKKSTLFLKASSK